MMKKGERPNNGTVKRWTNECVEYTYVDEKGETQKKMIRETDLIPRGSCFNPGAISFQT